LIPEVPREKCPGQHGEGDRQTEAAIPQTVAALAFALNANWLRRSPDRRRQGELAGAIVFCDYGFMQTLFEAAGGMNGMRRLADAWHRRVLADEEVSHAFSHGFHPQHTERLAAYWAEALGGPAAYSGSYGDETTVVRMHSGNGEHHEMDRRAIACFDQALADVGLAEDGTLRQVLHDYFTWATTTTMARYHESANDVPDGLSIPHWSWDGLEE
jgi:hemoglobin